ncbi:uncharacterized protein LOC117115037 [Anneissia japonica]|uniref:uncharacterized protein LOC117115037 n=1 Tax=Anneissia japonica TaxID=1529436 RepID=UPI001425A576|nr:uncharacterized protein LOC117115037 [Anneissia japonica]
MAAINWTQEKSTPVSSPETLETAKPWTGIVRCKNFGYEESLALIKIWGSEGIQNLFKTKRRHFFVWNKIAEQMTQLGYNRRPENCKTRIDNIKAIYFRIRKNLLDGDPAPSWPFWDTVHGIMTQGPTDWEMRDGSIEMEDDYGDMQEDEQNDIVTPNGCENEVYEQQNLGDTELTDFYGTGIEVPRNIAGDGEEPVEANGAPQEDSGSDPMPRPRKWSRKSPYPRKSFSMLGNHIQRTPPSGEYDGISLLSQRSQLGTARFAPTGNGTGLLKKKHRALERAVQDLVRVERERLDLEKQRLEMDRQLLLSMQTNMMWLSQAMLIRTGMQMPINGQRATEANQSATSPPTTSDAGFSLPPENPKPSTD